MSETPTHGNGPLPAPPVGDPWAAFGYLVAGVLFYGVIGWGLSLWLHAPYWIPIGILVGAGFGMYMVFSRYRFHDTPPTDNGLRHPDIIHPDLPHDAGRSERSPNDDQGETL
jgi:hypothetical protein